MSGALLTAVAAAAILAASLSAAGLPWAGTAHAAAGGGQDAAAEVIGMRWEIVDAVVTAGSDADGRDGLVVIAGTTDRPGEPILVTARAPDGSILDRLTAGGPGAAGTFLAEVPTGGPGWAGDGLYTITLYQGAAGMRPYVDIVPVAMSGGLVLPNAELSGAELGPAAAGYADPQVNNLAWSLIRTVSVAPDGGAAGGDVVRLSGSAPPGRDSVFVRVVAPTGLELAAIAADADGPSGAFDVPLETDGSGWAQDGTYRITVSADPPGDPDPAPPDLLLVDIFDGSLAVAASAVAAAADPRGEGGAGHGGAAQAQLAKRWEIIDAVAVAGRGGLEQRVVIAGSTDLPGVPVSVRVDGPQGRAAHGSTVMPDGATGRFLAVIPAAGDAWSGSGTYSARVEQRDGSTGAVYYADLLDLAVDGGAVGAQPRLAGAGLPEAIAAEYGGAQLVALEYAVVEEVRAEAPAGGPGGRYAEIVVSGRTFDRSGPLSVAAEAPDGSAAPPIRVEPGADGRFEVRMPIKGPFWSGDGEYAVAVTQGGEGSQFVDVAMVRVRDGAVEAARPPAAAAAAADGMAGGADAGPAARVMSVGERWKIIDAVVLAEDGDARQSIVVVGATDIPGIAVQATVAAPGGGTVVAASEAMPDASGAVVLELPVGGAAWGEPRPADGAYALAVGQPGTRYLDEYPLRVSGGRIVAPAEFAGAPVPLPAGAYGSARLLDMAWTLVERADVETSGDGSPAVVVIAGRTDHPKVPIEVRAEAPDGSPILDARIASQADGSFEARIDASGGEWAGDGSYRITLRQGFESAPPDLVIVEVVDGAVVPEFGAVAAIVLAAAVALALATASLRLGLGWPRPAA